MIIENEEKCSLQSRFFEKIAEMHSKMNSSELFATVDAANPLEVIGEPGRDDESMNEMQNEIVEEIDVLSRIN